jgi:hypothetical protein
VNATQRGITISWVEGTFDRPKAAPRDTDCDDDVLNRLVLDPVIDATGHTTHNHKEGHFTAEWACTKNDHHVSHRQPKTGTYKIDTVDAGVDSTFSIYLVLTGDDESEGHGATNRLDYTALVFDKLTLEATNGIAEGRHSEYTLMRTGPVLATSPNIRAAVARQALIEAVKALNLPDKAKEAALIAEAGQWTVQTPGWPLSNDDGKGTADATGTLGGLKAVIHFTVKTFSGDPGLYARATATITP